MLRLMSSKFLISHSAPRSQSPFLLYTLLIFPTFYGLYPNAECFCASFCLLVMSVCSAVNLSRGVSFSLAANLVFVVFVWLKIKY